MSPPRLPTSPLKSHFRRRALVVIPGEFRAGLDDASRASNASTRETFRTRRARIPSLPLEPRPLALFNYSGHTCRKMRQESLSTFFAVTQLVIEVRQYPLMDEWIPVLHHACHVQFQRLCCSLSVVAPCALSSFSIFNLDYFFVF